ncbi:hypothetical protein [Limnoraphis robusta]|uniref:hypothetical protein n=1 Tax=Limnoraphis robusta TaxID=1118279 RepID=UPI00066CF793|nr:hypothetical protein [Limnoraphis robusta]
MQRDQLLDSGCQGEPHSNFFNHCNPITFFFVLIISLFNTPLQVQMALAHPINQSKSDSVIAQSFQPGTPFLANGTYLYGQSPQRDQLGQAYMVFEVNQGRMVGAFYMPHSSFDCFWGTPQGNGLALTVIDSYTQETHPYAIGFNPSVVAASTSGGADQSVSLEGFYPIESISQADRKILEVCKSDLNQR